MRVHREAKLPTSLSGRGVAGVVAWGRGLQPQRQQRDHRHSKLIRVGLRYRVTQKGRPLFKIYNIFDFRREGSFFEKPLSLDTMFYEI